MEHSSLLLHVTLAVTITATLAAAADPPEPSAIPQYQKRVLEGDGLEALKHVVYVPDKLDAKKPVPLLIFLHGRSADCVTHERIMRESNLQFWHGYGRNVQSEPTILMAPAGGIHGWTSPARTKAVLAIIDGLIKEFPVDKRRVYLQGFSMGGAGTWHLLQERPGFFAAANPQGLNARRLDPMKLKNTPIWATIGALDQPGRVKRTIQNVAAIRAANGDNRGGLTEVTGVNPRFNIFPETTHGAAQGETQKIPSFKQWMYAQINDGNVPPNIAFAEPKHGQTFATGTVEVTAVASDAEHKIAKVEFYHGDKLQFTDETKPYRYTFENLPHGPQTLKAKAIDAGGKHRTATLLVQIGPLSRSESAPKP